MGNILFMVMTTMAIGTNCWGYNSKWNQVFALGPSRELNECLSVAGHITA